MFKLLWRGGVYAALVVAATALVVLVYSAVSARNVSIIQSPAPDPSCTSSGPCIVYQNNGAGVGLRGNSLGGIGLEGSGGGTSISNTGVEGISKHGDGVDAFTGAGLPASGTQGVFGRDESTGVTAGTFNVGVAGISTDQFGVLGNTGFNIFGISVPGTGVAAVEGFDLSKPTPSNPNFGVVGASEHGYGVFANNTTNTLPALLVIGGQPSATPTPNKPLVVVGYGGTYPAATDCNTGGAAVSGRHVASIDEFGNMILCGGLTQNSPPLVVHTTATAQRMASFSTQQTVPSIDDIGEAQLVGGQAYVPLDPTFATIIDSRANYLVFITPEGPSRGLYVSQKSRAGFVVRENPGGRSTLTFDYRIVAKPIDVATQRLPIVHDTLGQSPMRRPAIPVARVRQTIRR